MTHPANPLLLLNEVKKEKGGMDENESTKTRRSSGTSEGQKHDNDT